MLPVYPVDGGKQIGGCTPVPLEYVRCGSGNRSVEGLVDFKKIIDSVLVVILAYERRIQFSRKRGPGTRPILSLGTSSTPWIENRKTPITIFGGCVPAIQNHIGSDRDVASGNRSDNQGLIASQRDGTGAGN